MAVVFVGCLTLAGCAGKQAEQWQQDSAAIRQSLAQIQSKQTETQAFVETLSQRLAGLENQTRRQEAEVQALSASFERLKKSLVAKPKQASRKPAPAKEPKLIKKLDRIESSITKSIQNPPQPPPESEENSYTAAYLALKSGRYDEAAAAFALLTVKYPDGEYTDQALYWLGESYYAQHKPDKAIRPFQKVVTDYPKSGKHAAALFKLGKVYQELKRPGDAKAVFQRLTREYPDSTAAEHARIELYKLGKRTKK